MNTATKAPGIDLSFEQRWLLQELITNPRTTKLRIVDGDWIFTIKDVVQTAVPQEDITELAHDELIGTTQDTYGIFVTWWPTIAGRAAAYPAAAYSEIPKPVAEPDTSHLERIATALEDIAAGVLAIDAKLGRFIADVDGKDPWQSDAMAGHHE